MHLSSKLSLSVAGWETRAESYDQFRVVDSAKRRRRTPGMQEKVGLTGNVLSGPAQSHPHVAWHATRKIDDLNAKAIAPVTKMPVP